MTKVPRCVLHFAGKLFVEKMLPVLVLDDRVVHHGHVRCCCFASSDLVEVDVRNPLHVVFVQVVLVDGAKK